LGPWDLGVVSRISISGIALDADEDFDALVGASVVRSEDGRTVF
jgi:hypothetical protein